MSALDRPDDAPLGELMAIPGPTALGGDPRRFAYLAVTLAVTDFRLRFFGSVLGYFWQLMRPLLLFGVLYFVFTQFVKVGGPVPFYPVVLLSNIVLYTFFAEATNGAISSVVDRESLVRKIQFPRLAIPVSVVLTASFNLTLNIVVVIIFGIANGVPFHWGLLLLPVLIGILAVYALGFAMLLSAMFVRFRDMRPIWEIVLQILFYATPVIYAIETINKASWLKHGMMANPLAAVIQSVRHYIIDPGAPSAGQAIGGTVRLLVPAAIVVAVTAVGFWYFNRAAPRIAEEL
jgi:ABC-2 type transport system permease protein